MKRSVFLLVVLVLTSCSPGIGQTYTFTPTPTLTPTATPTLTPTPTPTFIPSPAPAPTPTPLGNPYIVQPGDTLSEIEVFYGVPYSYIAQENDIDDPNLIFPGQEITIPPWPPEIEGEEKIIVIDISNQMLYAYEGGELVADFLVSTGTAEHPTVVGVFEIYIKLEYTNMSGPGYHLPNVPFTMYFYQGYGIHGTYWHNNFGVPISHGCVNMRTPDAEWLFYWAEVGTPVIVTN